MPTTKKVPTDRPAELVAFLAIAPAVYSWLVSVSCPNLLAIVLAFVAGVVPLTVSAVKDARREADDPGDDVVEQLPIDQAPDVIAPEHEQHGIDHQHEGPAAAS